MAKAIYSWWINMVRYLRFDNNYFNFAARAEFRRRIEYFSDFVFGGTRDKAIYGLTRVTPELTVEYDVDGLRFLQYVLGTISANTISVASTLPSATYKVTVGSDNMSISDAKVDSWELTIEETEPVRAEFTVIGKTIGAEAAAAYTPAFCNIPARASDCTLQVNGTVNTMWNRIRLRVNNNIQPLFKGGSIPAELREGNLEVTGDIRSNEFKQFITEGSMNIILANIGTIILPNVRFTETPFRVRGWELPEAEVSFQAFPTCTVGDAIKAILVNTVSW